MSKLVKILLLVLVSVCSEFLFSQEVGDDYFYKELIHLRFLNTRALDGVDRMLENDYPKESFRKYSEAENISELKSNLVDCDENCFKKILKSKEAPIELALDGPELLVEKLYSSSDFKIPIGNVVITNRIFFVLNHDVYFLKNIDASYGNLSDQLNLGSSVASNYFIWPPMIPYNGPGRLGGAIWLPWLKKFGYYPKHTNFFARDGEHSLKLETNCASDCFRRGFRARVKLIDELGIPVANEIALKKRVVGYKNDGDLIRFYVLNENGKKYSNEVEGVFVNPNFLLKYYGVKQFSTYTMKKVDLISENGDVLFYQIEDRENGLRVNCPPDGTPEEIYRIKNGDLKFSDLEKFIVPFKVPNILFNCDPVNGKCE